MEIFAWRIMPSHVYQNKRQQNAKGNLCPAIKRLKQKAIKRV